MQIDAILHAVATHDRMMGGMIQEDGKTLPV
jgi:hypothetical protein